jgi:hydrogenase nickel incorporation protein HypA/HybF
VHEKHVIDDLIRCILETVKKEKGGSVLKISVWLGALSHMSPSHFQDHFQWASKGTVAEHAEIEIEASEDIDHPQANRIVLKKIELQ